MIRNLIIIFSILLLSNCISYGQQELKYIFIGHSYQPNTAGNKVDYRLEDFDFTDYKGIWLGGDVCSEATVEQETIIYLDSIFDLSNPETHWTLGNHDARNLNPEYIRNRTKRKTYYAYSSNLLTRIVLNTNLVPTNCEDMNSQWEIISNVCDTITNSKYLTLIMHHGLWDDVPGLPSTNEYAQSHLRYWNSNCYDVNSNFVNSVYPKLLQVKNKGINVICVMGDIGDRTNAFSAVSEDGIYFLGSGLYHNEADNNVLIFNYFLPEYNLEWHFHNLDSLKAAQTNN